MGKMLPHDWWLALDRDEVRGASTKAAASPGCLVLKGKFVSGVAEALAIVEDTLNEHGFTCHNVATYHTPGGFTNAVIEMFSVLSEPTSSASLPANLLSIREATPEHAVTYLRTALRQQVGKTAMLIDGIDEAERLTERELAALEDLAVTSRMPIIMTASDPGTRWQVLSRSQVLGLKHFTIDEVLAFVIAHSPGDTGLTSLDDLNGSLKAIEGLGHKGQVRPREAYVALAGLSGR
jgi:hypothetical protein